MGKPELFDVFLFDEKGVYLPGMWIEGVVQLRTKESIKARAIRLQLDGEESVSWSEESSRTKSSGSTETVTDHYSKTVDLMHAYLTLWGYPKNTDESTPHIEAGSYVFPFSVQIPANDQLPPSCDLSFVSASQRDFSAYVHYGLTAFIDIPMGFDIEVRKPITIRPRIPLNSNPSLHIPAELEELKKIGCGCCRGGTIQVRVRCLQLGAMPGDTLSCVAEIVNKSKVDVEGIEMSLVKSAAFQARGSSTSSTDTIANVEFPVEVGKNKTFSNLESAESAKGKTEEAAKGKDKTKRLIKSEAFELVTPKGLLPAFNGQAIDLSYSLVFRVRVDACCESDIRLRFSPTFCTQRVDTPVNTALPTVLNPSGQARSAVKLGELSTGQYFVGFSFDGLDCLPEEQLDKTKKVRYPCFYDPQWDVLPPSFRSFNSAAMQMLEAAK